MESQASRFTIESIETAVLQFYRGLTNDRLNSYLTQAQISPEAWHFSWQLLKTDKPDEVQYYGANTLHFKISRHWSEIPEDEIPALRDNLLRLLESHSGSSRAIVIRICVCLGCFILQTMIKHWPNALNELITSALDPCGGDVEKKSVHQKNMLEILTVIPEELQVINEAKKSQLTNGLIKDSNSVLQLIHRFLIDEWTNESVKNLSLKCLTSWLHLNVCLVQSETEPLVFLLFDLLRSDTYFNDASEALTQLFKIEINKKHPRTVLRYLKKVTELGDLFDSKSHDMDVTQSLTKIFVSAAENNTSLILNSLSQNNSDAQVAFDLLRLIVKTIGIKGQYPTEELCSDISFGFWYNFQDDIITQGNSAPHVMKLMMELFIDMFDIMTFKTKYPPDDEYSKWASDEKEVYRCYRQDFADAAAYFSNFVGSQCMDRMYVLLNNQLTSLHNNINVDWQEFDTIIYMMTSIMEGGHVNLIDSTVKVFNLLPHVPCTHPILITQIMFFIGSCAEVMDEEMFKLSIDFILKGLLQKEISSAASMSLKDLLSANKAGISLVSDVVLRGLKQAMDRNDMETSDYVRLANCLGYVVMVTPQDHALQALDVILTSHVRTLLEAASNPRLPAASQNVMVDKLKLLAGFFSSFSLPETSDEVVAPDHFIFQFIRQLLPGFKEIINLHIQEEKIMNELFEMLKRSVRSLVPYFNEMVASYCEIVCISYEMNPLPCILELAKSTFLGSPGQGQHQEILHATFISICSKSLQVLGQEPQNHPDVVEAFMIFLNQVMSKKIPNFLNFEYESMRRLFCAAMVGIEMKENIASKSSCQFMSSLILNVNLAQVIQVHGRSLLQMIILGVAVNLPRHNLNPLADVIAALLSKHYEFVARTLSELLSVENFPTAKSTIADKQQFLKAILSSVKCKRRIKETINEFAMLWRGFLNTEYGAQTAYRE